MAASLVRQIIAGAAILFGLLCGALAQRATNAAALLAVVAVAAVCAWLPLRNH